jgi:hypothetical protein
MVAIVIIVTYVTLGAGAVGTSGYFGAIGVATSSQLMTIGLISGFATGAVGALMDGASIGQALIAGATGALIGGLTAGLTHGIAANLGHTGNYLRRAVAHGLVSGVMNKIRGGNFGNGFMSTFFSTIAGGVKVGGQWAQGLFQTMVGGTASAIGGGKFANGAVSSAMVYLFNDVAGSKNKYTLGIHTSVNSKAGFDDGHAWISITNNETGEMKTYSLFSEILNHRDSVGELLINYELSKYSYTSSKFSFISQATYDTLNPYLQPYGDSWHITHTCADYARDMWYLGTGQYLDADDWMGLETPRELSRAMGN